MRPLPTASRLRHCLRPHRLRLLAAIVGLYAAPRVSGAQVFDLSRAVLVDLTHDLAADAPAWPGSREPFRLDTLTATASAALFRLALNEHFATHMDAPRHASGSGWTNEQIPLSRLVAPLVVIDVQVQAAADRDYALTEADVIAHEREHGAIRPGSIVLLRTGWSRFWGDPRYFGAEPGPAPARLHFPAFGPEAAQALVRRGVAVLGVDSPSTDIGAAPAFTVHGILGAANVPALENLTGLEALPSTGALLMALPIKTRGGSGGPVRVVALVPR